jgi:nickel/cobalt transporter (NicO) family protein
VVLVSMLIAFGLGAAHALGPGHGKAVVAAYLVGTRGTPRHALALGITVTITHTIGVFALGLATLFLSRFILPERLFPWLGAVSGLMVVLIGLGMVRARWRALAPARPVARRAPALIGAGAQAHGGGHVHIAGQPHRHGLFDLGHHHHDGPGGHTHLPPGASGERVTWRGLLTLGISGGLIPCPSALVVLLSAIALNRVEFGLLLIVAFSAGLAAVLTGIGLVCVFAGRLFARMPVEGWVPRLLPVLSALLVTGAGLIITAQALIEAGLLPL